MSIDHFIALGGIIVGIIALSVTVLGAYVKMNYNEHKSFSSKEECVKQSLVQEKLFYSEIKHIRELLENVQNTLDKMNS